jgi:hypothetical protein
MSISPPVIALAFLFCVFSGFAADDRPVKPSSVELRTFADPQFGPITIHATSSEGSQIESISLTCQSRRIDVPPEGLNDLKNADIASLHISVAFSDPAKPWLLLSMNSRDPKYIKIPGKPATISFVVDNGEIVRRTIIWSTDSGAITTTKHLTRVRRDEI